MIDILGKFKIHILIVLTILLIDIGCCKKGIDCNNKETVDGYENSKKLTNNKELKERASGVESNSLSPQEMQNWCWAATLENIAEYVSGLDIEQCQYVALKLDNEDCCDSSPQESCDSIGNLLSMKRHSFYFNNKEIILKDLDYSNDPLSKEDIINHIKNNTLIAYSQLNNGGNNSRHFRIIYGYYKPRGIGVDEYRESIEDYEEFYLLVYNPYPPNSGKPQDIKYSEYSKELLKSISYFNLKFEVNSID